MRTLPGDPTAEVHPRQVPGAAWSPVRPTPVADPRLRAWSPEVAGPLGFYWHDYTSGHMAAVFQGGMQAFARDPEYSAKLKAYAGQFTWQRAAQGYLGVYRDLLNDAKSRRAA